MPAPLGNKYALGNEGGRPPKFPTAEALQTAVDGYFNSLQPKKADTEQEEEGEDYAPHYSIPATITGLALYLGFESRQSLYDYEKNEEFSVIIKKARLQVENAYEQNLHYKNPVGSIFALKNMGWIDSREIKHDIPQGIFNLDPLSDDKTNEGVKEDSGA